MLLSIVIPCLNEEKTITQVVKNAYEAALRQDDAFEIIVSDNGSTDGSVQKVLTQKIARIVEVPIKGYGAALHWGILNAKGKYVLFADADLSYDFNELNKFIKEITATESDLVLGSRFKGSIKKGAMPFLHRYLGTPLLTNLIRLVYQIPTTDCNSGMRMVRRKFYLSLEMNNAGMEWASELLIRTAYARGKYTEVPIALYPDKRDRKPHLVPWSDGWRHLKAIVLLKPNLLFVITSVLLLISIAFLRYYPFISIFFFLLSITLFFCTLAAKLLFYSLDNVKNVPTETIKKLPLVPLTGLLLILGLGQFFIFPGQFQVVKMLVLNIIFVYCIWVFFIETIKTHLMNKLPSKIISLKKGSIK